MVHEGVPPYLPPRYAGSVAALQKELESKSADYFVRQGEARALALFHEMATRVPAYQDVLKKHHIQHSRIKKIADFRYLPLLDKDNYLRKYPIEKLCWDGKFTEKNWVISATSGSTGEPYYFPREKSQMWQYAGYAELYLRTNFAIDQQSTLYIDAFPMGPWIGGLFTYEAITTIAERSSYPLSIITTGVNKHEIINAVKRFGHVFDQIIIGCYGPFLKDALDEGIAQGIDWRTYNLRFIFSAEAFSEDFRDYVIQKTGLKNPCKDTLNHYGTVDQGTLAYETPLAILVRRLAVRDANLHDRIFPQRFKLPTFAQYDPRLFYFESFDSRIVCSAYSGLPLVRYDLKDRGGVMSFDDVVESARRAGVNLSREAKRSHIEKTVWRLPFVYVYERSDFSVSLYAFQIYPETIRTSLEQKEFRNAVTGKFAMSIKFDRRQNQYLEVNVELMSGQQKSHALERKIREAIMRRLVRENSEYRKTHSELGSRIAPRIVFWPHEHALYFSSGKKQKWVIIK